MLHATATVEQSPDAWSMMAKLAKVYVSPDADLPGGSEPGFVTRYAIDRITGIGPWTDTPPR